MERLIRPLPAGTAVARYVQALIRAKGDFRTAADIAANWHNTPEVAMTLKAFVPAMSIGVGGAGASLSSFGISQRVAELVAGASVLGAITPLARPVPLTVNVPRENDQGSASWVGEGQATPVRSLSYDSLAVEPFKSSTIIVFSRELAKLGGPSVEATISSALIRSTAKFLDQQFLDKSISRVASKNPASITNGGGSVASTGSTAAQIQTDLESMLALLGSFGEPRWVMKPSTAIALAGKTNTSGAKQFPGITAKGGLLTGIEVITSTNSPAQIALIDASDILLADGNDIELDYADQASLVMDTSPDLSPMESAVVSMWQRDFSGIRITRTISWLAAHAAATVAMAVSY